MAADGARPRGVLRLIDQRRVVWQNRGQFFGVACQMMRRLLVDRARAHRMATRSGQWARVTLDDAVRATPPLDVDVLALDAALSRLAAFDPRRSQLAELRFFGGLSLAEAAETLGISIARCHSPNTPARGECSISVARATHAYVVPDDLATQRPVQPTRSCASWVTPAN